MNHKRQLLLKLKRAFLLQKVQIIVRCLLSYTMKISRSLHRLTNQCQITRKEFKLQSRPLIRSQYNHRQFAICIRDPSKMNRDCLSSITHLGGLSTPTALNQGHRPQKPARENRLQILKHNLIKINPRVETKNPSKWWITNKSPLARTLAPTEPPQILS